MAKFISSEAVSWATKKINVDDFIETFNKNIFKQNLSLNTGLDHIRELNDEEFELAKKEALESGWILTRHGDNYNTITYKIELKKQ